MYKYKYKYPNDLAIYRQRMQFKQVQVARLLGYATSGPVSTLELGKRLPDLQTSLRLAAIYRVPVDFLYSDLYCSARAEVRDRERHLKGGHEGTLFGGDL